MNDRKLPVVAVPGNRYPEFLEKYKNAFPEIYAALTRECGYAPVVVVDPCNRDGLFQDKLDERSGIYELRHPNILAPPEVIAHNIEKTVRAVNVHEKRPPRAPVRLLLDSMAAVPAALYLQKEEEGQEEKAEDIVCIAPAFGIPPLGEVGLVVCALLGLVNGHFSFQGLTVSKEAQSAFESLASFNIGPWPINRYVHWLRQPEIRERIERHIGGRVVVFAGEGHPQLAEYGLPRVLQRDEWIGDGVVPKTSTLFDLERTEYYFFDGPLAAHDKLQFHPEVRNGVVQVFSR